MMDKAKILTGRNAIDTYREAHRQLHNEPWHRGIPEEHTPLLNKLLAELKGQGFNSIRELFDASKDLNAIETGIMRREIKQNREDLLLLTGEVDPPAGVFASDDGVELHVVECELGKEMKLFIDGREVMVTSPEEHLSMERSVAECPDNARVFIGGLGLGLVLLYLANSRKSTSVLVCEIHAQVLNLVRRRVERWFTQNYPDFNFEIINGDAFSEVVKHGKFDWIYIDLTGGAPSGFEDLVKPSLTDGGRYTPYKPYTTLWEW